MVMEKEVSKNIASYIQNVSVKNESYILVEYL